MKKSVDSVMPYCVCIVVIGGVLNFMVFLVLFVQDTDLYKDIRGLWTPAQCRILMRACSCTCCMLQPLAPCHCYGRPDRCPIYCPIRHPQPPLDANCSVPGRVVQTTDSYWGPGRPSCFLKYHNAMLVEYARAPGELMVASVYEVPPPPLVWKARACAIRAAAPRARGGHIEVGTRDGRRAGRA